MCHTVNEIDLSSTVHVVIPGKNKRKQTVWVNQTFMVYPSNTVVKDWIECHPCRSFHTNIYQEVLFFQTQLQEMAERLMTEVCIRIKALTQRQANREKSIQKGLNRIEKKKKTDKGMTP